MLVKFDITPLENPNISHSVTLVPRLQYSINLLDDIIEILTEKRHGLKKLNGFFVTDFDETDVTHLKAIRLEQITVFSLETLSQIKKRIGKISGVTSIPEIIPVSIPVIRTVSAQLFDFLPNCSQKLSELSVHLGSIVLDSAVLTKARFDFSQSNEESATLLNEVKLIVDSKINKQYPNLDFSKVCNT
ncbi:MAG: hypothetical protein M8319_06280 [Nitrosopumilus sp.]|nr:hypothetical protein [Nitrosopumilus sp.]